MNSKLFAILRMNAFRYAVYVIFVLAFQEVVLRICFPIPVLSNFDRINYLELEKGVGSYRHMRNQNWFWQSTPDTNYRVVHYLNQYGFRDDVWPIKKTTGKPRIIFIGDSFVEGIMANQEQTISEGFKQSSRYNYEIFNGGMMGTGLNSYLRLATDVLPLFKPDHLFVFISSNDLGQTVPTIPEYHLKPEFFNQFRPRLYELMLQIKDESPIKFRWHNVPKSYIPTITSNANPWRTNAATLSPHVREDIAAAMKNGEFSPFRTNNLVKEATNYLLPPKFGETFGFLKYFTDKFNCKLTVFYIPGRNLVTDHYLQYERAFCQLNCPDTLSLTEPQYQQHQIALAQECQRHGIPFINLTGFIGSQEQSSNHLYWHYDDHMRGTGYLKVGKEVHELWSKHYLSNQSR